MNFKNIKRRSFTQIDNDVLQNNSSLSWKAKGILAVMLSFPDDWSYSIADLMKRAKDGRDSLYGGLKELENAGYLIRKAKKDSKGKFLGTLYYVSDVVIESGDLEDFEEVEHNIESEEKTNAEPLTENPFTESPLTENPPLQILNNTNTNNTNIYLSKIDDISNISGSSEISEDGLMDTFEETERKVKEQIDYESFVTDLYPHEIERVDSIVYLMSEIIQSKLAEIKIAGEYRDMKCVKKRFQQLKAVNIYHITQAMDESGLNLKEIRNPKNYWLSALYNEAVTNGL